MLRGRVYVIDHGLNQDHEPLSISLWLLIQSQRLCQVGRHLATGDRIVGAVVVTPAAARNPGSVQHLDLAEESVSDRYVGEARLVLPYQQEHSRVTPDKANDYMQF